MRTGRMFIQTLKVMITQAHPRTHGADTKFLKKFSMADALSIPIILDLYDKFSMYYFFEMYFCG